MKTKYNWYAAKTGNLHGQGLVIEELTGKNIAVAYDGADTPLLAAAPAMLKALETIIKFAKEADKLYGDEYDESIWPEGVLEQGRAAIQAALGE